MFEGLKLDLDHNAQRVRATFHFEKESFLENLKGLVTRPWFEFGDGEPPYWVCGIINVRGTRFFIEAFGEDMSLYGDTFTCYVGLEHMRGDDLLEHFEEVDPASYWMEFIPVLKLLQPLH